VCVFCVGLCRRWVGAVRADELVFEETAVEKKTTRNVEDRMLEQEVSRGEWGSFSWETCHVIKVLCRSLC